MKSEPCELILKAIRERRSIRKYTDEVPPRELILKILDTAIWAPSGLNNQPWRFVIVKGVPHCWTIIPSGQIFFNISWKSLPKRA